MSSDNKLAADVSDELFWDPKVDNAAIAVSANDGTITLRGTVGGLREKREAKKAAQRVFGVISVDNQLQDNVEPRGFRSESALSPTPRSSSEPTIDLNNNERSRNVERQAGALCH